MACHTVGAPSTPLSRGMNNATLPEQGTATPAVVAVVALAIPAVVAVVMLIAGISMGSP